MNITIIVPQFIIAPFLFFVLTYRKFRYGYAFRKIELTEGKFAIVDPEDFQKLSAYKWIYNKYPFTIATEDGKSRMIAMHRKIIKVPKGMVIDHINRDKLDNRKANLRSATLSQNSSNIETRPHSSKFRGVHWYKRRKRWRVCFRHEKKCLYFGYFQDELLAAKVYDYAAKKIRGQFAVLNFPENNLKCRDSNSEFTDEIELGEELINKIEQKLDSFKPQDRKQALSELSEKVTQGEINLPQTGTDVNLHCHTFFSYNSYGYSPSKFAWLAKKAGLAAAGIVDFDVLDGLDEFLNAGKTVDLKTIAGLETRVFIPEFADKVINSPGEPGISYHMGVGFTNSNLKGKQKDFLQNLRKTSEQRNRELVGRVNKYLKPVELNYESDVLPLTPSGNATERHICVAYAKKAKEVLGEGDALIKFWSEKLGTDVKTLNLPESKELLNAIRAKTMKQGGAGYVKPDTGSFPKLDEMNEFILAAGAIPTMTWLDGTSDGEQEIERLLDVEMKTGVAAINIIPDRNFTPGVKNQKLANLQKIIEIAESRDLPVVVGTEMNSPGQKFADNFKSAELSGFVPIFLKGAYIIYAHSVLQKTCGLGYLGDWAKKNFKNTGEKNKFYETAGRLLKPKSEDIFIGLKQDASPDQILKKIGA